MHKSFVIAIAALLVYELTTLVTAAPAPKAPQDVIVVNDASSPVLVKAKSYRYVGNTIAETFPNVGINGMHENCRTDFGASARMCTTTEVFETPNMPSNNTLGQGAWVQPIISDSILSSTEVHYVVNGILLPESIGGGIGGMNCRSWSTSESNNRGALIITSGTGAIYINYDNCNVDFSVACCLPQ